MLLLIVEICLIVAGIIALVKGEITLIQGRSVAGTPARLIGVVLILPLPLSFLAGFIYGAFLGAQGRRINMDDLRTTCTVIELVIFGACLGIAFLIAGLAGSSSSRKRRGWDEEDDWGEEDRPAPRPVAATSAMPPPVRSASAPAPAPSTVQVPCPVCQQSLGIPAALVGESVRCAACNAVFPAEVPAALLSVECGTCARQFEVPGTALGTTVTCPGCESAFVAELPQRPILTEGIVAADEVGNWPVAPQALPAATGPGEPWPSRRQGARPLAMAGRGSATPWIVGAVAGGVLVVAVVVVVILLGQQPPDRRPVKGWAGGPFDGKKAQPWEEKKGPWDDGRFNDKFFDAKREIEEKEIAKHRIEVEEKRIVEAKKAVEKKPALPPRPVFDDALAQKIALAKGRFQTEARLDETDPLDRDSLFPAKLYLVTLQAGSVYHAELRGGAGERFLGPRLRLEDLEGRAAAVGRDDPDGGRARFVVLTPRTGTYRLIASATAPERPRFTLTLREVQDGDPLDGLELPQPKVAAHPIRVAERPDPYLAATIAPDSKSAWVAYGDGKLEHYACPAFTVVGTYRLPRPAYELALDGRGVLYATTQPPAKKGKKAGPPVGKDVGAADLDLYDTRALLQQAGKLKPTKVIPLRGVIEHLLVSPDGAWLYFLDTQTPQVGRVDLKGGKLNGTSDALASGTAALCLTPDGKTLYSGARTKVVQQLDAATLKIVRTFKLSKGNPVGLQATDRGHVFLNSGPRQGAGVLLLHANRDGEGETVPVALWAEAKGDRLVSLRLSADQKRLYTLGFDLTTADVTSYAIGERPGLFRAQQCGSAAFTAHVGGRGRMAVSRDGRFLFCDSGLILWLEPGGPPKSEQVAKLDPPPKDVELPKVDPPKEDKAAKVDPPLKDKKLPKVDPPKEDKLPKVDPARLGEALVLASRTLDLPRTTIPHAVAFSPDGKLLAVAGRGIHLWDVAAAKPLAVLAGHRGAAVVSVDFSADGKMLASGAVDGTAKIWDVATHAELKSFRSQTPVMFVVRFAPDGRSIAAGGTGAYVWDKDTGNARRIQLNPSTFVDALAFTPDGKFLALGTIRNGITLWDLAADREHLVQKGHPGIVWALAFSPDGTRLASGGPRTIQLWDAATGKSQGALEGHLDPISSLAFSPDGKLLIAGAGGVRANPGQRGEIKVWDLASHRTVAELRGHTSGVTGVAISPDGRTVASASRDFTLRLWDLTPLVGQARKQ